MFSDYLIDIILDIFSKIIKSFVLLGIRGNLTKRPLKESEQTCKRATYNGLISKPNTRGPESLDPFQSII